MRKKRGFIDIQNMKPRFTFIFFKKRNYKHYSTSSIFRNFQPSNCMIILCNWVPWRSASTLGPPGDGLLMVLLCLGTGLLMVLLRLGTAGER